MYVFGMCTFCNLQILSPIYMYMYTLLILPCTPFSSPHFPVYVSLPHPLLLYVHIVYMYIQLHSMFGWSVLVTLPVLLASAQGPSYGCCYNNTLVATPPLGPTSPLGVTAPTSASVQFSSSVVENGKLIPPPLGTQTAIGRVDLVGP